MGRKRKLTPEQIGEAKALLDLGYHRKSIAALFGLSGQNLRLHTRFAKPATVNPLPAEWGGWPLNWCQRVIWGG